MGTKLLLAALALSVFFAGCSSDKDDPPHASPTTGQAAAVKDPKVQANLAKLSPEDRKLAEDQMYCAVDSENPLGAMGVPIKVTVKDETVFLCCKSCKAEALAHPDDTVGKVKALKAKSSGTPKD
jgi:hypothetical protein